MVPPGGEEGDRAEGRIKGKGVITEMELKDVKGELSHFSKRSDASGMAPVTKTLQYCMLLWRCRWSVYITYDCIITSIQCQWTNSVNTHTIYSKLNQTTDWQTFRSLLRCHIPTLQILARTAKSDSPSFTALIKLCYARPAEVTFICRNLTNETRNSPVTTAFKHWMTIAHYGTVLLHVGNGSFMPFR